MKKRINIDYLARVEGEGGFLIEIKDGRNEGESISIERVNLNIFEAPRFFEAFLKGRSYSDVLDFTARICGICPVAYQMSAAHAIEKIFDINPTEPIRDLRRLLYCGEWISSHALHIYLLQGPDFYNLDSSWSSKDYMSLAKRGLNFKKLGNKILSLIGGRSVHPVSVIVGGFSSAPRKKDLISLKDDILKAFDESLDGIRWACSLDFNENYRDTEYISLVHEEEYPMNYGIVASNRGLYVSHEDFLNILYEYQVEYSTALHSGIKRDNSITPYMVGPMARLNLNHDKLPLEIKDIISDIGINLPLRNSHMSIIARSIELSYAFYEAIRLIDRYEDIERPYVEFEPKAGEATWITEAPRGMLIHKYEIDSYGYVKSCKLIPPTSQNMGHIERDMLNFIQMNVNSYEGESISADYLKKECEKIIRSYDPCISCSVHIVKL